MAPREYAVAEIFPTLQGEGFYAGTPAVFVRFGGCNLWSGHEDARERAAQRSGAQCPRFCDTDFVARYRATADEIATAVVKAAKHAGMTIAPLVVFTGGEPLLQLTDEIMSTIDLKLQLAHLAVAEGEGGSMYAVETNGTVDFLDQLTDEWREQLWVCVSPKVNVERLALTRGDELKIVWPTYDPEAYRQIWGNFGQLFISPCDTLVTLGRTDESVRARAAAWVLKHGEWRLSLQTHKIIGVP